MKHEAIKHLEIIYWEKPLTSHNNHCSLQDWSEELCSAASHCSSCSSCRTSSWRLKWRVWRKTFKRSRSFWTKRCESLTRFTSRTCRAAAREPPRNQEVKTSSCCRAGSISAAAPVGETAGLTGPATEQAESRFFRLSKSIWNLTRRYCAEGLLAV